MSKLKLCFFMSIVFLLSAFLHTSELLAEDYGAGDTLEVLKYEVTLNSFKFHYNLDSNGDTTDTWFTVFDDGRTLDIASANAGEQVGDFISGVSLPTGHIDQKEIVISSTHTIQAKVSYGGTTYYSIADGTASTDSSQYAEGTVSGSGTTTDTDSEDLTISEDTEITAKITFNLLSENISDPNGSTGCIGLMETDSGYRMHARPPNVSEE